MARVTKILVRDSDGRVEDYLTLEGAWADPVQWTDRLAAGYSVVDPPGGELKSLKKIGRFQHPWKIDSGAWALRSQVELDADLQEQPAVDARNMERGAELCRLRADRAELTSAYFTGHATPGIVTWAASMVAQIDARITTVESAWE